MQTLAQKIKLIKRAIDSKRAVEFDYIDSRRNLTFNRFTYPQLIFNEFSTIKGIKIEKDKAPSLRNFTIDRMSNVSIYDKDDSVKENLINKVRKIIETESFLELYKINSEDNDHISAIKKSETAMKSITDRVSEELNKI